MISQPAKVATPDVVVNGLVVHPPRVPAPEARPRLIDALGEVTTLPPESSTLITGWALKATPLVELPGDVVKTNWVADPTLMVKLPEVPEVNPVLAAERV